jgi:alkanesulfonate monooxygenase SsuD/methylene tetrahydromethanopterin reductase-like flavin-dependent oxidoreductase (luciferase family)
MARPTFGLRIPPCRAASEVAEFVRRAEDAGFDIAWLPDSQFLWRDVCGPSTPEIATDGILGEDSIHVRDVLDAAGAYAGAIEA